MEGFSNTRKAADRLGYSDRVIQRWCREGKMLGAIRVGREWRIPDSEIERHLSGQAATSLESEMVAQRDKLDHVIPRELIPEIKKLARRLEQLTFVPEPERPFLPESKQAENEVVREWVFIDGSPRTVRGRDALINGGVVPLFTAELAAGSSALRNSHWEAFERTLQRCVLIPHAKDFTLLPKTLPGRWSIVDPLDDGVTLADVYDEVFAAAVRRTRWLMRLAEKALALHLVQEGENVVADGPLSDWRPLWKLTSHLMGVIKRRIMTPEVWDDQERCTSSLWLSDLLRRIKVHSRSPVFRFFPWAPRGQSAPPIPTSTPSFTLTWWVRLRAPRPGDSPFSHLIRVELPPTTPQQGATLTHKVDRLTCGLLACQSPYLIDNIRGEELLYPIWVAETMVKVSLRPTVIHLALWS